MNQILPFILELMPILGECSLTLYVPTKATSQERPHDRIFTIFVDVLSSGLALNGQLARSPDIWRLEEKIANCCLAINAI